MQPNTHLGIRSALCGTPIELADGLAVVQLETSSEMSADDHGLIHGGFVFGLADYAAMLAVNEPNVVLGAAEVKFLAPSRVGTQLRARAELSERRGKKILVTVSVTMGDAPVLSGTFTCFVPPQHVLAGESGGKS